MYEDSQAHKWHKDFKLFTVFYSGWLSTNNISPFHMMICQHSSKERGMMCKRTASVCSVTFCVCARQSSLKKMARLGIHVTWRLISSSARTVKSSRMSLCPQFAFLVAVRPLLVNCSLLPAAFYFPVVDGKHNMAPLSCRGASLAQAPFYTHQFSFFNTSAARWGVEQQWPPILHAIQRSSVVFVGPLKRMVLRIWICTVDFF